MLQKMVSLTKSRLATEGIVTRLLCGFVHVKSTPEHGKSKHS